MSQGPVRYLVYVLAVPLPIQLSASFLGKLERLAQSLGPCTHVGGLEEAPAS